MFFSFLPVWPKGLDFSGHLQPLWNSSSASSNQRNRREENSIQANPLINNRGGEQRVNAPNTQRKAELRTPASFKCLDVGKLKSSVARNALLWSGKEQPLGLFRKSMNKATSLMPCSDRQKTHGNVLSTSSIVQSHICKHTFTKTSSSTSSLSCQGIPVALRSMAVISLKQRQM